VPACDVLNCGYGERDGRSPGRRDPAIEPGEAGIRITFDPARLPPGYEQSLDAFHMGHKAAVQRLRSHLPRLLPEVRRVEFVDGGDPRNTMMMHFEPGEAAPGDLTAVTARLDPEDLETLDTLVTAGITASRAQAVRWALARLRERPAYARLRTHVREIGHLKAEF
jgi:hypothetical protein